VGDVDKLPMTLRPLAGDDLSECGRCGAVVPTAAAWGTGTHSRWHLAVEGAVADPDTAGDLLTELNQLIKIMMDAGYDGNGPQDRAEWLTAKLAKTGPYVWRPGDPPPPPYVMVLHDQEDGTYLCRAGYGGTHWQWQDLPNHTYSGPALAWAACVDSEVHELVQVPGGDV
jgi:hypothetical protein